MSWQGQHRSEWQAHQFNSACGCFPDRRGCRVSTEQTPLSRWKRFRYRLEAAFLELLAALLPLLSRKMFVRVADTAGGVAFHLMARDRRIALTNLDLAFGQGKSAEEKRRIVRSAFQTFARNFLGLFWNRRLRPETLGHLVEVDAESLRCVRECHARGKGVIFVTLHYGEWELLALATALFGFPPNIVTEELRNPHVMRILDRLRARDGNRVTSQRFAMTKLFKALKRGECVALLIDLNALPRRGGLWLDFFGKPVFGHSGPGALAIHTGAAIVSCVAHPLPDGRLRVVYGPEIRHESTGDDDADLQAINQQCLRFCEDIIRHQPAHWLWFYKRWRFRPTADQSGFPDYSHQIGQVRPLAETASH
jgi:Kdo2-lipid IVA lauroyltransferase/acyltransferase